MSISSISSNYGHYQAGGERPPRKPEIDALDQALQTGDISSAQQAFNALFSANSSQTNDSTTSGSSSNGSDGIVADISALGKALSSGDLTSAQSAFSSLQDDIQNTLPPPPRSKSVDGATNSDTVQSLFDQLADALKSGDLSAAQSAFSNLQAAAPAPAAQSNEDNGSDPIGNDIASLSSALSSGDVSSAQTAFAQLQKDLQNGPPPPPPGGSRGRDGSGEINGDKVQQAFSDLATALSSGDLDAANTAFATLQSLAPENQSESTLSTNSNTTSIAASATNTDTIGTDLGALSDALQSGDLTAAQGLFATLLEDLQANAPRHSGLHNYAQNNGASSTSTTSVSVSA